MCRQTRHLLQELEQILGSLAGEQAHRKCGTNAMIDAMKKIKELLRAGLCCLGLGVHPCVALLELGLEVLAVVSSALLLNLQAWVNNFLQNQFN